MSYYFVYDQTADPDVFGGYPILECDTTTPIETDFSYVETTERYYNVVCPDPQSWSLLKDLKNIIKAKPYPFYHKWDPVNLVWVIDPGLFFLYEAGHLNEIYYPYFQSLKSAYVGADMLGDETQKTKISTLYKKHFNEYKEILENIPTK